MLSPVGPSEAEVLAGRSNMDTRYKADGVYRKRRMTLLLSLVGMVMAVAGPSREALAHQLPLAARVRHQFMRPV